MVGFVKCHAKDRPETGGKLGNKWIEVEIVPYDPRMAREVDDGWLQWTPDECIRISLLTYCCLAMFWPILRIMYSKRLLGQITDW